MSCFVLLYSWLEKGSSNMAVLEIGIPTGFAADKQSVTQHPLLKRTEDGEDKIILYFDEVHIAFRKAKIGTRNNSMIIK